MGESIGALLHKLIFAMDREADKILQSAMGLSYKRAYFLVTLQRRQAISQHELAVILGYSDPAVSTMLLELSKAGYVSIQTDPHHGRKRLVSLTPKGETMVAQGVTLLESHFAEVIALAQVDGQQYAQSTEKLYQALMTKTKEKT